MNIKRLDRLFISAAEMFWTWAEAWAWWLVVLEGWREKIPVALLAAFVAFGLGIMRHLAQIEKALHERLPVVVQVSFDPERQHVTSTQGHAALNRRPL